MSAPIWIYVFFLLAGAGLNLILTPAAIFMSRRLNLIDQPGHRKIHRVPVSKAGGLAVMVSILASVLFGLYFFGPRLFLSPGQLQKNYFILFFSFLAALLGLLDDLYNLRPRTKLLVQFLLTGSFALFGYRFEVFHVPGVQVFHLYGLAVPLTVLWMMAVVNGLNFTDILDGLAGSVCVVGFLSLGLASELIHGEVHGIFWLGALGALGVFLLFNWKPAKIYLGDCGATGLGFLLAASWVSLGVDRAPEFYHLPAAGTRASEPFWFQFFVLSLFAGFPLLEAALSTLRRGTKRFLMNRSMEFSEQKHIGHHLLRMGFSAGRVSRLVFLFQVFLMTAGLFFICHDNAFAVITLLPIVMVLAFFMPRFGFFDFLDLKLIRNHQPHFQIAHHFITVQRVKLGLALTRHEVLALVEQTAREFGVRCVRFKARPNKQGRGGLEFSFQDKEGSEIESSKPEEFFDYFEDQAGRVEALWIFSDHAGDDELDVEYRVLMHGFIEKALGVCVRLGEGQENIISTGLSARPAAKTSGHHLRKRRGRS